MVIENVERELLRQRALENWGRTKDLRRENERQMLRARIEQARTESAAKRARELTEKTRALRGRLGSFDPSGLFEYLVDRALERAGEPLDIGDGVAALVASGGLGELVRLKQLANNRCSYVLGALDAGTALGLAITMQPDLAIIGDTLEVASGVEVALTLPTFTPRTNVLVLTDDDNAAHELRSLGIGVGPSHAPNSLVLSWIDNAA